MKEMKVINKNRKDILYIKNFLYKNICKKTQYETIINDSKYYLGKIKKILIFIMFCHIYYFYYISLESCFDGEGPCSSYIKWIKKKVKQEIVSCLLLTIMVQLIMFKKIAKAHLIHITIMLFFFFVIAMV